MANINPHLIGNLLRTHAEDPKDGPKESHQMLSTIYQILLNEHQNWNVLNGYLLGLFNKNYGIIDFIGTIMHKKTYKPSILTTIEILYTFINNFPAKLSPYIQEINEVCIKLEKSSYTSADEKAKALSLLTLSFQKINETVDHKEHYLRILDSLNVSLTLAHCDSVCEKVYATIGEFIRRFHYLYENESNFLGHLVHQLDLQVFRANTSYRVITGIFVALNCYATHFPLESTEKLLEHIQRVTATHDGRTIKTANRAALEFLADNMKTFISSMMSECEKWHGILLEYLEMGAEERKVGAKAVEAFYVAVSQQFPARQTLQYFLEYFKPIITYNRCMVQTQIAPSNLVRKLALRGFTQFAQIFFEQLKDLQIDQLSSELVLNFERIYAIETPLTNTTTTGDDELEFLPEYVTLVAQVTHLEKVTAASGHLAGVQRAVVAMFRVLPALETVHHSAVIDAMVCTCGFLIQGDEQQRKCNVFETFIANVVYQCVCWTCSNSHVSEIDNEDDGENASKNLVTFRDYMFFWKGVVGIASKTKYDQYSIYWKDRQFIVYKICERLVKILMILINKLDVSVKIRDEEEAASNSYCVAELNDFAIFLNVVDFYCEILETIDSKLLTNCIGRLVDHLVIKCIKHPLISGFYKLLASCLQVYNTELQATSNECLKNFLTILTARITTFKDDLLVAAINTLLNYPTVIVEESLTQFQGTFERAFFVGRTFLPIASSAIATLEHWQSTQCINIDALLLRIVPHFDGFLKSTGTAMVGEDGGERVRRRKTAQRLNRRQIRLNYVSELTSVQRRMVRFIGAQNVRVCRALAASKQDGSNVRRTNRLKVTLFPAAVVGGKKQIDLYLDGFLPRLVHLSLYSTERSKRITACEALHAFTLIFLGSARKLPQSALSTLSPLLEQLVGGALLKLACDTDFLVKQLFEPLLLQMVHWCTHPIQSRSEHSTVLIEALLDGIAHPTDMALREFSARCVREYMHWTLKSSAGSKDASGVVRMLMRRTHWYALHPDPAKKLGAALIFNAIYVEVREECTLFSGFWVEFLWILVSCLKRLENKCNSAELCVEQLDLALERLQRGFVEKCGVFNVTDRERRVPDEIRGPLLADVAVFLLNATGGANLHCHRKCVELFVNIVAKTPKFVSICEFIDAQIPQLQKWLEINYETNLVTIFSNQCSLETHSLLNWQLSLIHALKIHVFLITNKCGVEPSATLTKSIQFFVEKISAVDFEVALKALLDKRWIFTEVERQEFFSLKAICLIELLRFLTTLFSLNKHSEALLYISEDFLQKILLNAISNPEILGFNVYLNGVENLRTVLGDFLGNYPEKNQLWSLIDDYLKRRSFPIPNLNQNVNRLDRNLMEGINFLSTLKLFPVESYAKGSVQKFFAQIIQNSSENRVIYVSYLQHTTQSYFNSFFDFVLKNEQEFADFINILYECYTVESLECLESVNLGVYLLNSFEDSVLKQILSKFKNFVGIIAEKPKKISVDLLVFILNCLNMKNEFKLYRPLVTNVIFDYWLSFEGYFDENTQTLDAGIELVVNLVPFMNEFGIKSVILKKWLINLLQKPIEESSDSKTTIFTLLAQFLTKEDESDILEVGLEQFKIELSTKYEKLFATIPSIKSPMLLTFLVDLYVQQSSCQINAYLSKLFQNCTDCLQSEILDKIYTKFFTYDDDSKQKLLSPITVLLQHTKSGVLDIFLQDKIERILETLADAADDRIADKILSFVIVEILFVKIDVNLDSDQVVPIAVPSGSNKAFAVKFLKISLESCKGSSSTPKQRSYRCHSYKAAVSILLNSVKSPKLYGKLFLREENNGEDVLWKNLIDLEQNFTFGLDFDSIPNKRKTIVNIRSELSKLQTDHQRSANYIESVRIYNSSLSEDISKYDFSNHFVRDKKQNSDATVIEIELDSVDVNNHELMSTVCGLIQYLSNQTDLNNGDEELAPEWIGNIHKLLLNKDTHKNIKIFWIKVLDNTIHAFKDHAQLFLEPVLQFICEEKCAGDTLNYFVCDVLAVLAQWSKFGVTPKSGRELELAAKLFVFLVTHINRSGRADIFKYHLELVKVLVEAWGTLIQVPEELVFEHLCGDEKREAGVQISAIFLANKLQAWPDGRLADFCKRIFNLLMNCTQKSVYRPLAELLGLTLRYIERTEAVSFAKIRDNVHKLLQKISDFDKYTYCLQGIAVNFPSILNTAQIVRILSLLHAVHDHVKIISLELLERQSESLVKIGDFHAENWTKYLQSDNSEVRLLVLKIIHKTIGSFNLDSNTFGAVLDNVKHPNVACRKQSLEIIKFLVNESKEYGPQCKNVLIIAISDADEEIRRSALEFWTACLTKKNFTERFIHISRDLFIGEVEEEFLSYACYLLLNQDEEETKVLLFEDPLEDCDFQEYKLQTSWRKQHVNTQIPMFAETLRTFSQTSLTQNESSVNHFGELRQTRDYYTFEPTQYDDYGSEDNATRSSDVNDTQFLDPNTLPSLRRRFLRDKTKIGRKFANMHVKRHLNEARIKKETARASEGRVEIFRKYRRGDLPDIQIELSAILGPLKALALQDDEIARILYCRLFESSFIGDDGEKIGEFSEIFSTMFKSTQKPNANLFIAIFEIALKHTEEIELQDMSLVKTVCENNGIASLGVLLLEEMLENCQDASSQRQKRPRVAYLDDTASLHWLKLAELYKNLGEWDVVNAIFLEKLQCKDNEKVENALIAESNQKWRDACDLYQSLLSEDDSPAKKDFYYDSYFKCFAHLGEWTELGDAIESAIGCERSPNEIWSNLWDGDWNQEKLLPIYFDAKIRAALDKNSIPTELIDGVNQTLQSETNGVYLQRKFVENLCVLWLFTDDMEAAKQQLRIYFDGFVQNWRAIQCDGLKFAKLNELRNLVDVHSFVDSYSNISGIDDDNLNNLINHWEKSSMNDDFASVLMHETRVLYKQQFFKKLSRKLQRFNDDALYGSVMENLLEIEKKINVDLMNNAIAQKNYYIGRKYYKKYGGGSSLAMKLSLSRLVFIKSEIASKPSDKFESIIESTKLLAPILAVEDASFETKISTRLQLLHNFEHLHLISGENSDFFAKHSALLTHLFGARHVGSASSALVGFSAQILKDCLVEMDNKDTKLMTRAYEKLAFYFAKNRPQNFGDLILSVLRAMKLDSFEAKQLFPCIINEENLRESDKEVFLKEIYDLPIWMVLGWIPQLLATVDTKNAFLVSPLVIKIAETYPQSITYAYRLSKETFTYKHDRNATQAACQKLDELLLSNEKINQFLSALSSIAIPSNILLYYWDRLMKSQNNAVEFEAIKERLFESYFVQTPNSRDANSLQGNIFKTIGGFRREFESVKVGNLQKMKTIKDKLMKLRDNRRADSVLLKDYCPLLAHFPATLSSDIEIPGQYDGKRMPLVQYHVKISGFKPNITILSSLRRPIKLTIIGSDTKEYPFLVKYGEDLRQDQRIEQLFGLMNTILEHQHTILTYQVVPLTQSLGLIQWIEKTVTLNDFITTNKNCGGTSDGTAEFNQKTSEKIQENYAKFIRPTNVPQTDYEAYGKAAVRYSRDKVTANFRNLIASVPGGGQLLKHALHKQCVTNAHYYAQRSGFVKSWACLSVAHWLLGIGDRHLSNFMVDTQSGAVLGIDFGHAFGTATQILGVPELVPIRLTPQLVALLQPVGVRGMFGCVMVEVLARLRCRQDVLLAAMNVFVAEPSIDWLDHANRLNKNNKVIGTSSDETDDGCVCGGEWYPLLKLDQAARKLNGVSSAAIMIEDLEMGHKGRNEAYTKAYAQLIRGVDGVDLRARHLGDAKMSVQTQVDCLLDHAGDYNLLGRMYNGWLPWI